MSHIRELRDWCKSEGLAGVVVPSTDAYLSEFAPPADRRLHWLTGFSGSAGVAVVLAEHAALFVPGRYLLQARLELESTGMTVAPTAWTARRAWLQQWLTSRARLAIDPWLHSLADLSQWQAAATEIGFDLELLAHNPIDQLWSIDRPRNDEPVVVDYPAVYAGATFQDKCAAVAEHLRAGGLRALLVADPEDVSWLLNVRAADAALRTVDVSDWPVVPSCRSRALLWCDGRVTWFVEQQRLAPNVVARGQEIVTIAAPNTLPATLASAQSQGVIGAALHRTPTALVVDAPPRKVRADDTVARQRWRKHPAEIRAARDAHALDAAAVVRFMAWLARTIPGRTVTERTAAQTLAEFRAQQPAYRGPSMPFMSASGVSGAQPHYVPSQAGSRDLNDHAIYWLDSGGHYAGGTTDNTLTLAVGEPEAKHIHAHTVVLQAFIALASASVPLGTYAFQLDTIARHTLWRDGMDCPHAIGHGVGNFLNIHEGPFLAREPDVMSAVPIEPGMIITNEPGYYAADDFGVRIESHMVVMPSHREGFLEFETISRLPIDPRLVDFGRLSAAERDWLASYHRQVLHDVAPLLDERSASWLAATVGAFSR